MKKHIKTTILLLSLTMMNSSCENFLSEVPDNRTQIDTPEKIAELLVNAYPLASYMELAETMTDNVFDSGAVTLSSTFNTRNYNWEINDEQRQDTPAFYWDACYNAIAHANKALEAINKLGNPTSLNPQKGEALLARAYAHFMLVSLWSQRYNPATAAKDLGIPYVLTPENVLIKPYKRNSVAEVFDFIQKDLEEGLKYVTDNHKQPKFHFNKMAAMTFASRFYLIKGDWNKVMELSSILGNQPLGKLRDYKSYLALNIVPASKKYSLANEPTNLLIATVPSFYYRSFSNNRFQLTGEDQEKLFGEDSNLFEKPWLMRVITGNGGVTSYVPKFYEYFKIDNENAGTGVGYVTLVLLSNDELYLNRIEAHVMTNQIATANAELEYFLSTRVERYDPKTDKITETLVTQRYPVIPDEYTPFYALTPVQRSYIKAIAEIRRREFIHEGLRWFDIKRFGLKIIHETLFQPNNVLLKDDKRKVLQIPVYAANAGLEKNPR